MMRLKIKKLVATLFFLYFLDYLGVFDHLREKNFYTTFNYPLFGDINPYVQELRQSNHSPVPIINSHDTTYIINPKSKCNHNDQIRVVYVVKSAINNVYRRQVIRKTWGYEKRFSDVCIKTVFTLGLSKDVSVSEESSKYGDIIQGNFIDNYYNNTIKTMMGLKWTALYCNKARFYLFVDDDYYVSTRNVLRFLRNPLNYPKYLEEEFSMTLSFESDQNGGGGGHSNRRNLKQLIEYDIPKDAKLYAGYVFPSSSPHRHRFSRWYISLQEYPYHRWPPYVTGGAYVLTKEALMDFYYGSFFVQPFRFDDIYLGILAKKLDIPPFHSEEFYFTKKYYSQPKDYSYVVASHGYSDPDELLKFWNKQKEIGNA